jgi:hypothetical protein
MHQCIDALVSELYPFELAAVGLRALGITLARLPGEYRVNFHNGTDATARTAETFDEALELGRSMAAALQRQQTQRRESAAALAA